MFYNLISKNVNKWINSKECKVKELVNYIYSKGELRDAQLEALKTYLFLKIKCENKPLSKIFSEGYLESDLDIDNLEVSNDFRNFLKTNSAARMLYEIAIDEENELFINLKEEIKKNYKNINFETVFNNIFYNTSYTDYIFSLPMGAGKTYLMAMFIYLDLYFAMSEPKNKAFAHNFIILAPSGLKSSIVPSLKTIQDFDVSWIIPEPAATNLKKTVKFEMLDANKTAKKSNRTKNPNVNIISNYQPFDDLFGLIMVTNAEKVILNRIELKENKQINWFDDSEDKEDRSANELRNLIGKIPSLSVFIDEVHHAADDDIKLRQVVKRWHNGKSINSVIGFSGTPYLEKNEPVKVSNNFEFKTKTISSVVYYYPLIKGIDNFLKRPEIKSTDDDSLKIVESGVRDFLDKYKETKYSNGTIAKLAIYCGKIENLEEHIYPLVYKIVEEYGMNPDEVILKYHQGNKNYKLPEQNRTEFISLDTKLSKKKIVLLVQIGKEGWDCKSLAGVILSQKGDCPTNMILQTSCRCLRQVVKGEHEKALIWLNEFNRKTLDKQLKEQQNISISEFQKGIQNEDNIKFIDRTEKLNIPSIKFIDIKLNYETEVKEKVTEKSIKKKLNEIIKNLETSKYQTKKIIETSDIEGNDKSIDVKDFDGKEIANYKSWRFNIVKESMKKLSLKQLNKYDKQTKKIYEKIIYDIDGIKYYNEIFLQEKIRSNIRQAFYDTYELNVIEEKVRNYAGLLKTENLNKYSLIEYDKDLLFPTDMEEINEIKELDNGKKEIDLDSLSKEELLEFIKSGKKVQDNETLVVKSRNVTFHYLPYYFSQSGFEKRVFEIVLKLTEFQNSNLEIYYNGEKHLTEFRIRTYKKQNGKIKYNGLYTPDFIIIKRDSNNEINKILIIETKGKGYSKQDDFLARKKYMEKEFLKLNNEDAGYRKFHYIYVEDTMTKEEITDKLRAEIKRFFKEEK